MANGLGVELDITPPQQEEATQGPKLTFNSDQPQEAAAPTFGIGDTTWRFLDGDTIKDSETGESVRLRGINTRETAKFLSDSGFKQGEAGGDAATAYIWDLAQKHGFNRVIRSGEEGEYGRSLGDLVNEDGHSFVDTLLKTGVASPWHFSDKGDVAISSWGMAAEAGKKPDEPKSDWENARQAIYEAETEQYGGLPVEKLMAFDAAEYNANPDLYMGMKIVNKGADYEGRSRTPFGTGFDTGFATLYKSLNRFGEAMANRAGADEMEASFAADAAVNQQYINALPTVKMDVTEIDWTSFDEVTTGMMGMLGTSLPFMGATIAGMAAAPVTSGTSLALPMSMYTGMVLDSMEGPVADKNLGVAMAAGTSMMMLDRLGLKGLVSPKLLITKEGRETVIDAIAKKNYSHLSPAMAKAAASQELLSFSKKQMLTFVDDAKEFTAGQLQKGHLFREGVKRLSQATASEGVTEALQELTEYTAAVIGSEKEWNYDEIEHRMTNAIVAGGLMGTGFATPGLAAQVGGWKTAADPYLEDDGRSDSINKNISDELAADNNGEVPTIDEFNIANAVEASEAKAKGAGFSYTNEVIDINERADEHVPPSTTLEHVQAFMKSPMVALRASMNQSISLLKGKSKSAVALGDIIGTPNDRVLAGVNMLQDSQQTVGAFTSMGRAPEQVEASFKAPASMSSKQRSAYVSELGTRFMRQVLQPASESKKPLDWSKADADLVEHKEALLKWNEELQEKTEKMRTIMNETRALSGEAPIKRLSNWAYRHKSFRREQIAKDKDVFSNLLMKEYRMSRADADAITDNIINNESVNTFGDAFDLTKVDIKPSSSKIRELNISDKSAFDSFLEQNIFKNMDDAVRETARFKSHRTYLGKDMSHVNLMLKKVNEELRKSMSEDDARKATNKFAFDIRNIVNAISGNYKPILNQNIKQLQKYTTLLTALQGLSNAAISSVVEMPMLVQGVPREVIVKNAASSGYLFGSAIGAYLRNLQTITRAAKPREEMQTFLDKKLEEVRSKGNNDPRFLFYTNMKGMLKEAGFTSQETGAATTTGVQETNELTQGLADAFFKANFLHDQQDMHRMVRMSFFNDFLVDKLDTIKKGEGKPDTRGVAEAKMMLRELGIPVNVMTKLGDKLKDLKEGESLSEIDAQQYKREFLNGASNFVNQAAPLPSAVNRPLFYSDPHYALLTQFNGFTSTFTANQLPRLWNQLKGNGTLGLQYGTVAAMSNMLLFAFLSQGLKDELKYGESSPYLTDNQKIQRAIYSSGLLGTTERVIGSNFLFPLYGSDTHGTTDFIWENVAGEAAASGTIGRMYNMLAAGAEDDGAKFERNFYGSLPFIAPYKHRLMNITWE